MDLVETDSHFVLRADLPGMSEKDVKIELQDNVLTIAGERRSDHATEGKEGYFRLERASGSFSRSLTLPDGVNPAGVTATFTNGVLEVRIAKPEVRKPQKIEISVGGADKPQETIEGSETGAPNGSDPALAASASA
jgi:HSP20 family protein